MTENRHTHTQTEEDAKLWRISTNESPLHVQRKIIGGAVGAYELFRCIWSSEAETTRKMHCVVAGMDSFGCHHREDGSVDGKCEA